MQMPMKESADELTVLRVTAVPTDPTVSVPYAPPSVSVFSRTSAFLALTTATLSPLKSRMVKPLTWTSSTGAPYDVISRCSGPGRSPRTTPAPSTQTPAWVSPLAAGGGTGPARPEQPLVTGVGGGTMVAPFWRTSLLPFLLMRICSA